MLCFVLISIIVAIFIGVDKSHQNRIVDGEDTTIEEHPYQVSLQIKRDQRDTQNPRFVHVCGGSILNNVTILTAAHCMVDIVKVRAGSTFRSSGGKYIGVLSATLHPKYSLIDYDVAVIKLKEALDYGPTIQPIEIQPIDQIIEDGTIATVTGWGRLREHGPVPEILQKVEVKKVNPQTCQSNYILEDSWFEITSGMTCYSNEEKGVCQEDSGGPLVVGKFQVGIVSWSIGCASRDYPGVYANLQNKDIQDFIFSLM